MLDAARRAGVRRVVHTSTGATVGFAQDPARPLREDAPPRSRVDRIAMHDCAPQAAHGFAIVESRHGRAGGHFSP